MTFAGAATIDLAGGHTDAAMPAHASVLPQRSATRDAVVARAIRKADLPAVCALLHQGFPRKSPAQFLAAMHQLGARPAVDGFPRYGHVLQSGPHPVGALLTIATERHDGAAADIRCNVACWYVLPDYRVYAPLLVLRTSRHAAATHINVGPAENTWRTITSQGFAPVSTGTFAGFPLLARPRGKAIVRRVTPQNGAAGGVARCDRILLQDHAAFGCISLICEHDGEPLPFVFRRRRVQSFPCPGAQLIYCRAMADLPRAAAALGRTLAAHGMTWLFAGANDRVAGMPGVFFPGKMPVYAKGPVPLRPGDLSYTEAAMFGF